jgi:hypothetical protein
MKLKTYKVISNYPDSPFVAGQFIHSLENNDLYGTGEPQQFVRNPENFPKIFQPMERKVRVKILMSKSFIENMNEKLNKIAEEVAEYSLISIDAMKSQSRKLEVVAARHLFLYLAVKELQDICPMEMIGQFVNRDRALAYNVLYKYNNSFHFARQVDKYKLSKLNN